VIDYDRSAWWRTMFSFHGTVLPAVLGRVGLLTGLSLFLCVLDEYVLTSYGAPLPTLDQLGHVVLGTALGLFIVFRTNSSFARFWEARSHWGGLINSSRNLVRVAAAYAGPADDLARLVAAYAMSLKQVLRNSRDFSETRGLLPAVLFEKLAKADDPPGLLARAMSDWIHAKLVSGAVMPAQAKRLEELVCSLVEFQGGCEKIHRTPMPFVYASLIKQILFVYLASLPFVLVAKMGFAFDPNAIPLEGICQRIASNVAEATRE
jgi:putative membrane protein